MALAKTTFLAVAFLLSGPLHASSDGRAEDTVPSSIGDRFQGRNAWILEDREGELPVSQAAASSSFVRSLSDVPNLGSTRSAFWLRLDIRNPGPSPSVLLTIPHPEIDELDIHLKENDRFVDIASTGQSRHWVKRADDIREFAFALPIPVDSIRTVYIRVRSSKQLQVPILVSSESRFHQLRANRSMLIGGYVGIMLVMALYNLFVYTSIRNRSYLIYVLYILSVTLAQLTFVGIGQFYLWPDLPWWAERASIILTMTTAIAASQFMRSFVETRVTAPNMDKWTNWFYAFLIGSVVIYAFIHPIFGYQLAQLSTGLFATWLFVTALRARRQGSRQAGFFLLAWSAFLIGVVVYVLKDIGVLPYNDVTIHLMPFGSAVEAVLLSFGLADRINVLRKEKEQSQAAALASSLENQRIIREQNVMLEEKVTQRTHALQESNEHLKRTQTQLVNAEKMASLGQLTAGIAHEINNPINFITSNIQPLRRNISEIVELMQGYRALQPENAQQELHRLKEMERKLGIAESIDELDDIIGSISEGSTRTAEIVRGLRNFSRLDEDDLKQTDINEGIQSTLSLLAPQFRNKVFIELDLGLLPKVECYPGKVNQVLMNVLVNAIQATIGKPEATRAEVRITTRVDDDQVHISIVDNGIGMSEDVKTRMFDPFFTTKPVGEGTGLGLAIVYGIIQDHHGSIVAESAVGRGSEFRITLPIQHPRQLQQRA